MVGRRYQWEQIRTEYVTGGDDVTHATLIAKYGCAASLLKKHSVLQHWTQDRREYREMTRRETLRVSAHNEAEMRVRHIQAAKQLQGIAMTQLRRKMQPHEVRERNAEGVEQTRIVPPEIESEMSTGEIRAWIKDGIALERAASGVDDEIKARVEAEVEGMFDQLRAELPIETYQQVLKALATHVDSQPDRVKPN